MFLSEVCATNGRLATSYTCTEQIDCQTHKPDQRANKMNKTRCARSNRHTYLSPPHTKSANIIWLGQTARANTF